MFLDMKFIIVLVFLHVASSVDYQENKHILLAIDNYLETAGLQYREECIKTSGVDPVLVEKLEKKVDLANDDKLKCYIQCQGSKAGVVDENGVINMDMIRQVSKATNQKFLDMVESNCKLPTHPHLCEAAFEMTICVFDILVDHHQLH